MALKQRVCHEKSQHSGVELLRIQKSVMVEGMDGHRLSKT